MMNDKKILDRLTPVDADALRWRVMMDEVGQMKDKLDKLNMLIESLPCVCANRKDNIPTGRDEGPLPPETYSAKKEPLP